MTQPVRTSMRRTEKPTLWLVDEYIERLSDRYLMIGWAQHFDCVRSPSIDAAEWNAIGRNIERELAQREIIPSVRPVSTGVWESDGKFGVTVNVCGVPKGYGLSNEINRDYLFDTFEDAALFLLSQPA